MEKKQYFTPETIVCQLQSEGIMYVTSIGQGEDWNDAKQSNFLFEDFEDDAPEPAYPQAASVWEATEKYDQW